jgi:AcrR family transcriptional regulator
MMSQGAGRTDALDVRSDAAVGDGPVEGDRRALRGSAGAADPSRAAVDESRPANDASRAADDPSRAAADASRAAADLARSIGEDARREADRSRRIAESTRSLVKQAIAEAREALKDTRVEVRFERIPREERRRRTRERLLDAAAEVFNRLGYQGASLDAVAEAAGFTKGAVYSNFATKGELFGALLQRYSDERITAQEQLMETVPLEQVADMAGATLEAQHRQESTWDLLQIEFWLAAMRDPELRKLLVECSQELYDRSGPRFDRKFAEADLHPPFTGREFARVANALGSGLLLQLYLEPDAFDAAIFGKALRLLAGLPATRTPEGTAVQQDAADDLPRGAADT